MNIIDIQCDPYYLLAIINSRPISFWFAQKFGKLQRGLFPQFKINELASFPIPFCSEMQEKELAKLAKDIVALRKENFDADTSALETKIDNLVCQLYGLTKDEMKKVEFKQ